MDGAGGSSADLIPGSLIGHKRQPLLSGYEDIVTVLKNQEVDRHFDRDRNLFDAL